MKRNNGITLIALVITIVVLIILASVAITLSLGENGIFKKAAKAKEDTLVAQNEETTDLASIDSSIEEIIASNRGEQEVSYYEGTHCNIQKIGRICILQINGGTYSMNSTWKSWEIETVPDEYKPVYQIISQRSWRKSI